MEELSLNALHHSTAPKLHHPVFWNWSPRLVSRQRLLLFREALICLSYSGKRCAAASGVGAKAVKRLAPCGVKLAA